MLLEHLQKYSHPVAVDISRKLYVDNLLSGAQTKAEAIAYFNKAREIMHEGHFVLRQWSTNSKALQEQISSNTGIKWQAISPLGLQWDASKDCINFPVKNFDSPIESLTKRKVLSIASQLFDNLV